MLRRERRAAAGGRQRGEQEQEHLACQQLHGTGRRRLVEERTRWPEGDEQPAGAGQCDQRNRARERSLPGQTSGRDVEAPGEEQPAESEREPEEEQTAQLRRARLHAVRSLSGGAGSSGRGGGAGTGGERPGDEVAVLPDDPVRDLVGAHGERTVRRPTSTAPSLSAVTTRSTGWAPRVRSTNGSRGRLTRSLKRRTTSAGGDVSA